MATTNDITGDKIQSKPSSQAFRDNFDTIFGKSKSAQAQPSKESMFEYNKRDHKA